MDLAADPPLRFGLVRLAGDSALLAVQLHHIAGDGGSVPLLIRELGERYAAALETRDPEIEELGVQYADFAAWQRAWLRGDVLERDLEYWRRRLAGAPTALDLPTDRPRPARRRHRGGEVRLPASHGLGASIERLRRETGATAFGAALAAFAALLFRLTGRPDVVVGSPVAGRVRTELEPVIGLFANTVALRIDADGGADGGAGGSGVASFRDLAARVRELLIETAEHQHLPFEKLVEALEPTRDLGRNPLFQVMLLLDDAPEAALELPGVRLRRFALERTTTLFDLTLVLRGSGEDLSAALEIDRDLFDPTTAARLLRHLAHLAADAADRPDAPLGSLALLARPERHQVLAEWQGLPARPAPAATLSELALSSRVGPGVDDRIALVWSEGGDVHWSHGELRARATQVARCLRELGQGPGSVVGVLLERRPELVAALLGVLEAGAAYLPLDPRYPAARLELMLSDAEVSVLLTDAEGWRSGGSAGAGIRAVELAPRWPFPPEVSGPPSAPVATADDLAYVIYTSGSTGRPKGVAIEHRSAVAFVGWALRAFAPTELSAVAASTSVCFDLSVFELFAPLAAGGTVVLVDDALALDPGRSPQVERVRLVNTVPSVLAALLDAGRLPSGVEVVNLAGEPLGSALVERLHAAVPSARVFNLYGPSEDTTYSTCIRVGIRVGTRVDSGAPRPPGIGRPVDGSRALVLGPGQRPLPAGAVGEIHLAGAGLARGYLRRPALTAERFVPDGFSDRPGGRLYRTGDRARLRPDGELEFLGRLDHQVKLRGFRIELGEVEEALRRAPGVGEAVAAVAAGDADTEIGDGRLVAYVLPAPGAAFEPAALRRHLEERLPPHLVPQRFVRLDELPRRPNGKIDRRALPEPPAEEGRGAGSPPRTEMERLVAGLVAEVLGIAPPGADASFFDLGGHSLLAARLTSRLSRAAGVEIPLTLVFERPTVRALAAAVSRRIEDRAELAPPPIPRGERPPELPLSFAQERLWLAERIDPGGPTYTMPFALRLEGELDVPALRRALGAVVARHEALRTVFRDVEGVPEQVVLEGVAPPLPVADLGGLPPSAVAAEARRLLLREARRPFDLARGPLLRALLVRRGPRLHVLGLMVHHIVFDGASVEPFVRETAAFYRAARAGEPAALPELPIQYPDYALWQRRRLRGPVLERLLAYWRRRLSPPPETRLVAPDRPGRPSRPGRPGRGAGPAPGGVHAGFLGPDLVSRLEALGRSAGTTLFMTLLAGLQALLARLSGATDVAVGADQASRDRIETEGLIGFFVDILVLRTALGGDPTFRQILGRARRTVLEAFAHRELPLEKLVEALRPDRRAGSKPLFQVLLVLQNAPASALELPGLTVTPEGVDTGLARFDLTLFAAPREGGLEVRWDYRADRFEPATVARLATSLEALLAQAAEDPERRLSVFDIVNPRQTGRQPMEAKRHGVTSVKDFKKFRRPQPTAVAAGSEMVRSRLLEEGRGLPLLVEPAREDVDLAEWAAGHRERIGAWLREHGGVLFRGFDVPDVPEFEGVAEAVCPGLYAEYGDLPRADGGSKVYTSTPYPPDKTILFHNESSHLQSWPRKQFFYCSIPAAEGGETPLVDCRTLHRRLPPDLVARFSEKGLLYVRNFVPSLDVSWQDFFGTGDRAEVEARCRRAGIDLEWRDDGGLRTRRRAQAVAVHPETGERIFFNQIALHHPSCLDPETRGSLEAVLGEGELPRDVRYGDGSPIDDGTVREVLDACWRESTAFRWQAGDLVLVDNMLVAHARNPYRGPRKLSVAMGEMQQAADLEGS
jgi:amino acid adenylation domain-containing protein